MQKDIFQDIFYMQILNAGMTPIQARYIAYKLEKSEEQNINSIDRKGKYFIIDCTKRIYKVTPLNLDIPATPIEIIKEK